MEKQRTRTKGALQLLPTLWSLGVPGTRLRVGDPREGAAWHGDDLSHEWSGPREGQGRGEGVLSASPTRDPRATSLLRGTLMVTTSQVFVGAT